MQGKRAQGRSLSVRRHLECCSQRRAWELLQGAERATVSRAEPSRCFRLVDLGCLLIACLPAQTHTERAVAASKWINAWMGSGPTRNHNELKKDGIGGLGLGFGSWRGKKKKIDRVGRVAGRGSWIVGCRMGPAGAPDAQIQLSRAGTTQQGIVDANVDGINPDDGLI